MVRLVKVPALRFPAAFDGAFIVLVRPTGDCELAETGVPCADISTFRVEPVVVRPDRPPSCCFRCESDGNPE